jgi:DNA replication and repair protein RecF
MVLDKLSILNYKNIKQANIAFAPKINCLLGNNGMGKTNLLDAIYFLSFCKSYANTADSQIIAHGQELCIIQGDYNREGNSENIFCAIRNKQKKSFKRNKKDYDKLSEHIGLLPLVMISPNDHELIQGGSGERRRFLDLLISQHDQTYLHTLINYNKALMQRNTLLRQQATDNSLYDAIEAQLAIHGQTLNQMRTQLATQLIPIFNNYYQSISQSAETVNITYISKIQNQTNTAQQLQQQREHDKTVGHTTFGAHKDELEMKLQHALIRKCGSQGQNKTFLIALKLAQFTLLKQQGQTPPILLLDDIFDKLDTNRVEQIIQIVNNNNFGQIFITDTNRQHLDRILADTSTNYALFNVNNGNIQPET